MTATPFDSLTITFEVSWTTDPYATPAYVDESAYVRGFTVRRGRRTEFDVFSAGTMTVEVNNSTRRFDPLYTGGALFGNKFVRRKCRMSVTYSAVTYRLFTGFLDGVPQTGEPSNTLGLATFTATDGMKMFARTRTPLTTPVTYVGDGDTVAERVERLLDYAAWPAADRDIDVDAPTMIHMALDGTAISGHLTTATEGDLGQFFIAGNGDATYRGHRWQLSHNTTAAATVGDDTGEIPYQSYTLTYDDQQIFNRAMGSCTTGNETTGFTVGDVQDVTDSTSVTAYGESVKDIGAVGVNNTNVLLNTLEWIIAFYKDEKGRVEQVTFNPRRSAATMYPVVLAAEIGVRWTFKRRPQNVGSAISQDVIVQGVSYTMTPDSFTASFDVTQAPTPTAGGSYWLMGVGAWNSTTVWA